MDHWMKTPAILMLSCTCFAAYAQCPPGETEVTIEVLTDDYGYEVYWELLPGGSPCGVGTIHAGGNTLVGCTGAGQQQQQLGGYGNNQTIVTGPFCLEDGGTYDIFWADDWGDGGLSFRVFVSGQLAAQFTGSGAGNTFSFTVATPAERDMAVTEVRAPRYVYPGMEVVITGDITTWGSTAVNSFDLHYAVEGGAPVVAQITGLSLAPGSSYEFTHPVPWVAETPGSFGLEVWADNINGGADEVPSNDQVPHDMLVLASIPNIVDDYLSDEPVVEIVATSDQDLLVPRDLDFHPDPARNELWVINKDQSSTGGSTVRFFGPGEQGMTWLWQRDPNAWHFMNLPTGIAFGDNGNFATAPGIFDANQNGGSPFTGPSLWDADPAVYAQPLFGPLGSHIDMLHVNPECQGIAHELWNRYWVVDGHNGDITMNDFRKDHGPGNSWHGDAIISRYQEFSITKDPNDHIVSHLVLDKPNGWMYVVDHGGQRVLRMDINTGTVSGDATFGPWETYVEYNRVTGYDWEEIIAEGLVQPAGIDVIGDRLLVSDHATGDIVVYDLSSQDFAELGRISTGSPGIMGIKVGPDGHIWFVNATFHRLGRVLPGAAVGIEQVEELPTLLPYPNPAADVLRVSGIEALDPSMPWRLHDPLGRIVRQGRAQDLANGINLIGLSAGAYQLCLERGAGLYAMPVRVLR